ncbi:MAG TPA: hypothetical protein VM736_08225 [Gemmatimonadales bacterium]|nr:hypothetical protein [Gemmatimonadales bacterium]
MMARRGAVLGGVVVLAAACWEHVAAPGNCPAFCPTGQIQIVDTVLPAIISRDSAFRGYVSPYQVPLVLAAALPSVDGRSLLRFNGYGPRWPHILGASDTTTGAILGSDSARLRFTVSRRDTGAHNLTLRFYRLPITVDTNTTFAAALPWFADSLLVHTVNLDTLLARPGRTDSLTGDSAVVDTLLRTVRLSLRLDSAAARYIPIDSGTVAYGLRVAADSLASIALPKTGFALQWYLRVDSAKKTVARTPAVIPYSFGSFVQNPLPPTPDSTLAVGGVPSARSLLRVAFPRFIRDSASVIRGTLTLIPATAAQGAHADSFIVEAHTVYADYGAKSPVILDATRSDTTMIRIRATDTVRIEVTNVLQYWAADTTRPTTLVLRAQSEGQSFSWISFYPSVATAFRPALHITFLRRFPFGVP